MFARLTSPSSRSRGAPPSTYGKSPGTAITSKQELSDPNHTYSKGCVERGNPNSPQKNPKHSPSVALRETNKPFCSSSEPKRGQEGTQPQKAQWCALPGSRCLWQVLCFFYTASYGIHLCIPFQWRPGSLLCIKLTAGTETVNWGGRRVCFDYGACSQNFCQTDDAFRQLLPK